jgi:hypothetical protein
MRRTMTWVVALLLGAALGVGATLGVQAITDEGTDTAYRDRATWQAIFEECVHPSSEVDKFLKESEPELYSPAHCRREADRRVDR